MARAPKREGHRDPRAAAALALQQVLVQRLSLNTAIDNQSEHLLTSEASLFKALCFGVTRHYGSLSARLQPLLDKPLRNKDKDVFALLLIGAFQLDYLRTPDYAAIDSCVKACRTLKKDWAAGLVNAILRRYQQQLHQPLAAQVASEHPAWLYKAIREAWPDNADEIFSANNAEPPLCIRVNVQRISRADWCARLDAAGIRHTVGMHSPCAVYLLDKPADIRQLPGFAEGECSVQDEAPQLSPFLLELAPGQRVLDACAAPGGKTCHILETEPQLASVLAVDIDPLRLKRVAENLARLHLQATCLAADIADPASWWDGQPFDRILCDAPCSATGVIRRHPDIKWLRLPEDIAALQMLQGQILRALWQTLRPGGILLYATCSILPDENNAVVTRFLCDTADAELLPFGFSCGLEQTAGIQLLPQPAGHDGFFYARLKKREDSHP